MEFFQFHPTGLAGLGILLSEAARGEGGILRNADGERFMERYAPTIKDLAPRDIVARSMANEVREGRGAGPNKDYVLLDLTHLEPAHIDAKLPDITEFARTYLGVEPYTEPVPVYPTAHYAMGGVPDQRRDRGAAQQHRRRPRSVCRRRGRVRVRARLEPPGHQQPARHQRVRAPCRHRRRGVRRRTPPTSSCRHNPSALVDDMVDGIRNRESGERVADLRKELQETMDRNVQVFRTEASMKEALGVIDELKERYANVVVQDKGKRYNTDLLEAVELGFLIELAEVITLGALARKESRGGHFREDYEARDDVNFMRHTMAYRAPVTLGHPRVRRRGPPRLQARDRDPLPADGAQVLMTATVDAAPKAGAVPSFTVTLKISRFNPEVDTEQHWETYQVTSHATDRVLDALHQIKWEQDGSLSFRRSCAHGVCGSDAMRINGKNRLACKTLIKDVNPDKPITVEPIKGLPVEKDLIVDMEPFFDAYREVMPFLITTGQRADARAHPEPGRPRQVRRHDQVHPLRGLHDQLPGVLERRPVLRPGRHRQRAPLHLRQPRRGRRRSGSRC